MDLIVGIVLVAPNLVKNAINLLRPTCLQLTVKDGILSIYRSRDDRLHEILGKNAPNADGANIVIFDVILGFHTRAGPDQHVYARFELAPTIAIIRIIIKCSLLCCSFQQMTWTILAKC